jgi:hypothetical protein
MTERIAITEETKAKLNEFKGGAGVSFDDAIALLLELATLEGEDLKGSGAVLRFAKLRGHKISKITVVQK